MNIMNTIHPICTDEMQGTKQGKNKGYDYLFINHPSVPFIFSNFISAPFIAAYSILSPSVCINFIAFGVCRYHIITRVAFQKPSKTNTKTSHQQNKNKKSTFLTRNH